MKPDNTMIALVTIIPHAITWTFGHAFLDLRMDQKEKTLQKIGIGIIFAVIIAQIVIIHELIYS